MNTELFRRKGVRYEVACDLIGALIAHHAEAIAKEEAKEEPDTQAIAREEAAQRELRDVRDALNHDDEAAIERVIAEYGPRARAAYQS